ncbi:ATP phosphoribosyltransferase regulatory subunit [Clostridium acetireducens DSM 10703]|uniref:ATP phosphoribosyltransferase regulatory subunit n=1 Tax=Clostridium acetireducens DSM 10703 TaxID=1121290 RepID=A0A1E8EX51_9CLOT|nr:ATP phosphoribosyltransferase regulatory subunit [Clostridium acetireducens]OFI05356.1 ATP phosphoribosyltransferase regulatory subunit [Clostridium acetireducens DSM 10703]
MRSLKRYIPDGMQDILFNECDIKNNIENQLRNIFINNGFKQIISPTLEFYDVFNGKNVFIEQEQMYKLFDSSGRILALRPDMTTPIARIVSTKLKNMTYPLKLYYISNIFRVNQSLQGKLSEITQAGVEIIGCNNINADVEAIIIAINTFLSLNVKDFKIEIGESNLFKTIAKDLDLNEEDFDKLKKLIENKNFSILNEFLDSRKKDIKDEHIKLLKKLPELFGGCEVLDKVKELTSNYKVLESLENIKKVYKVLKSIGLDKYLSIDLGMVQNIDYYTGIIFRGYGSGLGKEILTGGRYDNLIGKFGFNTPATGFAININNLMEILRENYTSKNLDFLIHCEERFCIEGYNLCMKIRKSNRICEFSLSCNKEEALKYAKFKHIKYFIYINNKENIEIINVYNNEKFYSKIENFNWEALE